MLLVLWWLSQGTGTAAATTTTAIEPAVAANACCFVGELTEHLQRRHRRGVTRRCSCARRNERLPLRGGQRTARIVANVVVVVVVVVVIAVSASNSARQLPFSLRQYRQLLGAFSHELFLPLPLGRDPLVVPRADHCQCVQLRRHDPELALRKAEIDEEAATKRRRRDNEDDEGNGNSTNTTTAETTTRTTTRTPSATNYQWY